MPKRRTRKDTKKIKKRKGKKGTTKKNKKKDDFIKDTCNINVNASSGFTCYTGEILDKLKSAWNKKHPEDKINYTDNTNIWKNLKEKLQYTCRQESCWMRKLLNKLDNKKKLINEFFAPFAPKEWKQNPNEWLSSIDIKSKTIYYFDSVGEKVPKQIKKFCKKVQSQATLLGIELDFDEIHPHEHQKEDTECGIYSLFFITNMIKNVKMWKETFKKGKISDDEMTKYRKVYFNTVY